MVGEEEGDGLVGGLGVAREKTGKEKRKKKWAMSVPMCPALIGWTIFFKKN